MNKTLLLQRLRERAASRFLLRRRLLVVLLGLLAGLLLTGCTTTSQGERRLNLSPFLFYSEDPQADRSRLEILGPLFSRERAGDRFPVYRSRPCFII